MLTGNNVENPLIHNVITDEVLSAAVLKKIKEFSKNTILKSIGNTPLIPIKIRSINLPSNVRIFAKAEWMNPGGSIKDRAALYIISEAILSGKIFNKDGTLRTIVDASSGNTAIGYSLIASVLGIKIKLFIPKNASEERIKILRAYGANLVLTDPMEGIDGAIKEVREFVDENSDYFYLDQYNNDWNWKAHYYGTGREVLKQTKNEINYFVSCLGTSGSFMGIGKRLRKALGDRIKLIAVQPDSPLHGIEGVKHIESSIVPKIYDSQFPDEVLKISTTEAVKYSRLLAKNGLLVGTSSGAAFGVCIRKSKDLDKGNILTIFPDRGDRYVSTNLWG